MKIAIVGSGKTGSEVIKLLPKAQIAAIYNTSNPPTAEKLHQADCVIIFAPGSAVTTLLPMVLQAKIPAVWGSTGFVWPQDLNQQIKTAATKWIIAANFSLGMNLMHQCLKILANGAKLMTEPNYHIYETHHINKKDKPSGTALNWQKWLGVECEITSIRKGDINGIHELIVTSAFETISLKHEAHSRALFAQGAIWAAKYLLNNPQLKNGLYKFEDIVAQELL